MCGASLVQQDDWKQIWSYMLHTCNMYIGPVCSLSDCLVYYTKLHQQQDGMYAVLPCSTITRMTHVN